MERTRLRNIYLKLRTEATKVIISKEMCSKRSYFKYLDVKFVKDNTKNLEKNLAPFFKENQMKGKYHTCRK